MQMMFGKLVLVMCSVATIKRAFCSVGMKMGLKAKCSLKEKVISLFFCAVWKSEITEPWSVFITASSSDRF